MTQGTQISLADLGFSRTSAIALSEVIAADDLDGQACLLAHLEGIRAVLPADPPKAQSNVRTAIGSWTSAR